MAGGFDEPAVLFDLGLAFFIGEVPAADRASPVCAVAVLGAGGCLGLGFGEAVTLGFDDPAILCDLVFAVFIGEELAADGAGPVCAVAVLGAGGFLRLGLSQAVTRSLDDPAVLFDLGLAFFIGEVFAASGTSPVCAVAVFRAGGSLRLGLGHAVTRRGLHHGSAERFRAEGLTRGFFGIDREIIQVGTGFHRIAVSIGFPDLKGTSDGVAAAQIDELHVAGAGDLCRACDGRGGGIRGDRDILCAADGQRTTHNHAVAFVGERNVTGAGNIRIAGDRRVVGVCGDRNILRTVDGQRAA